MVQDLSVLNTLAFASDNYSGICPEAWDGWRQANRAHDYPYGEDCFTKEACDLFRELFETDCEVFFVLTGTAANSLALSALCQSYHSILCAETAHIETDECGAPEFFSNGAKILLCPSRDGKLLPTGAEAAVAKRQDIHYPKPEVISVTQSTELGTLYRPEELNALAEVCRRNNLRFHMDGARFANALSALRLSPKALSWQCGVDVLCLGGAKNGLAAGEAVLFFNKALAADFAYRCKQAGQLLSKMRFISAPWVGLLKSGAWLKNASQANRGAARLEEALGKIPGVDIMFPREANACFVRMPEPALEALRAKGWHFYAFIGVGGARFVCGWDTTEETIQALVNDVKSAMTTITGK